MRKFFYNNLKKSRAGVTLIELLVVVAIIGVIATIGFIALSGGTDSADDVSAKQNAANIREAMELARLDSTNKNYPKPSGLLATPTAGTNCKKLTGTVSTLFGGGGATEFAGRLAEFPDGPGSIEYFISYPNTADEPTSYRIVAVGLTDNSGGLGNVASANGLHYSGTDNKCNCTTHYCVGAGANI